MRLKRFQNSMDERIYCGIVKVHFRGKAGEKTLSGAVYVNFAFKPIYK